MRRRQLALVLLLAASLLGTRFSLGQNEAQSEAWRKLNALRRANGASLLAWNAQLATAAQRHAEDMASNGFLDELGSDGSAPEQRIAATGYPSWQEKRVWAELLYAGRGTFDDALRFFQVDEAQRTTLLDLRFREVGIGIASDGRYTYWVVTLGAQPNVLPMFINDGDAFTNQRTVSVQIAQEEAMPQGGANAIGRIIEVRLSERPDFADASWQRWEPLLPFTLSPGAGVKTIYAEVRDAAGRIATTSARIEYDPTRAVQAALLPPDPASAAITPPPLPTLDPSLLPTPTPSPQPTPLPTQPIVLPKVPRGESVTVIVRATPTPMPAGFLTEIETQPEPSAAPAQHTALPLGDVLVGYLIAQAALLMLFVRAFTRHRPL
ncbi:MAG: CAP domain-containing protein [Anaerolineae bacterium]|nr:CAP domain-containing protein [Thermoflexales bacterium]MCX7938586.1 CAP domain-containing protein [Thermoflexales bacterium]MDW8053548.1 CAP domain-containing protein [Anaerolineae bacterium]